MTSLNRIMTFAVFVPGGLILGGCASLGVHDTQSLLAPTLHAPRSWASSPGFGSM
jgi:hypothetical protein